MPQFSYKAYGTDGQVQNGRISAANEAAVLDSLSGRNLVPFDVQPASGGVDVPWWAREITLSGDTVPWLELAQFLRGFALMLKGRLMAPEALSTAAEDVRNRRLSIVLSEAEQSVAEGGTISEVLGAHPKVIPARIVTMIRLGEEANRMTETVAYAADMMEREVTARSELKSAMTYPIILLLASLAVVIGLIFLLAPALEPVFTALRAEPPWAIGTMLAVRAFILQNWGLVLAGLGLFITGGMLLMRTSSTTWERMKLSIPYFGKLIGLNESLRGLMSLSLMLQSGAPVLSALGAAKDASNMKLYADFYAAIEANVRAGGSLGEEIGNKDLLPVAIVRMIRAGERSDQMGEMLSSAVTALDAQVRTKIQNGLRMLTPILTLVIGGIIGVLIFSTLSAILEINELAF